MGQYGIQCVITLYYSYAVIMVSPTLTAVTVPESDPIAMIELTFNLSADSVPITITYVTTDGTATGIDCI